MAAAGNPTISTFLELRDNMSAGVKSVSSEIDKLRDAAKAAEDAIIRMKHAQAMRPPKPPPPPKPPRMPGAPGAPGGPAGDELFKFSGGIFNAVTRANLLVDAIEGAVSSATHAVAELLKYTIKVGEQYESTQLSITNTLVSMSLSPSMRAGQERSLALMTKMREAAAVLPGEAKDYIDAFALTLPAAISAGEKDVKKYAEFINRYMSVAILKGVDAPQAGRDLVEMLRGVATTRTKTFTALTAEIKMAGTEFNKLSASERFKRVTEAIEKSGQGMSLAAETANAKFGELKSRLEEIAGIGGKPFFEAVKSSVSIMNRMLSENKQLIMDISSGVSVFLGDALRGVAVYMESIFSFAVKYRQEMSTALSVLVKMVPLLDAAISATKFFASPGKAQREREEQIKQGARSARVKEVMAKYPGIEAELPMPRIPAGMLDVKPVMEEYKQSMRTALKGLWITPAGKMREVFKSSEDWATFVEAKGFDPQSLWDEMVKEKLIKLPTFEGKHRELKVEFNNNRFDIRQEFAEGFDPDRIAVAFASDLARAGEMKLGAVTAPTFSTH